MRVLWQHCKSRKLSDLFEGVQCTPRVRGGASLTYYAVAKSGELSALFERTCLGVKMTGVSKCLGCKMSGCQNVFIFMQWHIVWVAYCLGVKMSCCQNVLVSKYLVFIMSGCQKGWCQNVLLSKCLVPNCRRITIVTHKQVVPKWKIMNAKKASPYRLNQLNIKYGTQLIQLKIVKWSPFELEGFPPPQKKTFFIIQIV